MEAADFWNDPEVSQKKMKELKSMKDDVATYASLTTQFETDSGMSLVINKKRK